MKHLRENEIGFEELWWFFPEFWGHRKYQKFEERPNIERQGDAQKLVGIMSLCTV